MKLIIWGLAIVALCYAAYSGMIAAWSWIAVNNAVDEVIARDGIAAVPTRHISPPSGPVASIRPISAWMQGS